MPEGEQRTDSAVGGNATAVTPQVGTEPTATAEAPTPSEPEVTPEAPAAPVSPVAEAAPASAGKPVPAPGKPEGPAPTPAAFAKKTPQVAPAPGTPTYSDKDIKEAESFGREDDEGNVFVK